MQDNMKVHLKQFLEICYSRLEEGNSGGNNFRNNELLNEIIQELADVANYAFLEYVKITELQEKMKHAEQTRFQHD